MAYSDAAGRTEWIRSAPGFDEVVIKRTELDGMKVKYPKQNMYGKRILSNEKNNLKGTVEWNGLESS